MEIMQKTVLGLAALMLTFMTTHPSLAFKPEGHRQLEWTAYNQLHNEPTVTVESETFSGHVVLEGLMSEKVLLRGADRLPFANSDGPDEAFERQFDTKNQAFHFMAANEDVLAAAVAPNPEEALLRRALPKNLALMRLLFNELVQNPVGAYQAGRGAYVLIHIVGDSFSREHVVRDDSNHLITIKGWKLLRLTWPDRATRQCGSPSSDGTTPHALLHHSAAGGADLDWQKLSADGKSILTDEGKRAVNAIKSLVATMFAARRAYVKDGDGSQSHQDALWAAFVREHFSTTPPSALADVSLKTEMLLSDADSYPFFQVSLAPGLRLAPGPKATGVGQLFFDWHKVPGDARNFFTRARWGFISSARVPFAPRNPAEAWYSGIEATVQLGASTLLPVQWLGLYLGAGIRAGAKTEPGLAVTIPWNLYGRGHFGFTARWENNVWLTSGYSTTLGIGVSFVTRARRVAHNVKYQEETH